MPEIDVNDLQRALAREPVELERPGARLASVAAMLDARLDLLFIRRAEFDGDPWSGHVSFPGGTMEAQDASRLEVAVRETREELGLELGSAKVLGALDDVSSPTVAHPNIVVRPFVFVVDRFEPLRPNGEVAAIHTVPLGRLLDGRGRGTMPFRWQGQPITLPRVDFDGVRLWGMTLRMVDDLLHRLDGRGVGLARGSP